MVIVNIDIIFWAQYNKYIETKCKLQDSNIKKNLNIISV